MSGNIVIAGAGQAGVAVAFNLRALGYEGDITLVSEEPDYPYHRPPLSKKYLTNESDADRLHIKHVDRYQHERIELLLGARITDINREKKTVSVSDGQTLAYEQLVLATGARPRVLPQHDMAALENIYTFRTLADAARLRQEMISGKHLVVIGGGYIGLETAAVASSLGMTVTVIERDTRILGRVAAPETSGYFDRLHASRGVRILTNAGVDHFSTIDNRVTGVQLTDGTQIDTDVVVVGIGVIPETDLAQRAGLAAVNGIVVNNTGGTIDPSIYAVGDCASFPYETQHIRLESVQNAVDMAQMVAKSILGKPTIYTPLPWFWSDQYDTKLQIAGLNLGYTHTVARVTSDTVMSVWYFKDEKFIAVDAINDAKAFMTAKKWIAAGESPDADDLSDARIAFNIVKLATRATVFS